MPTPPEVLAAMLRSDPGRPRVTYYDDTPGPTQGERIELSAKVLANWVNKAANALQEEFAADAQSAVLLDLPPHWRSCYWALATWSVGALVVLGDEPSELVVTDDATTAATTTKPAVLVTLAALARSSGQPELPEVLDEARELALFADQFTPWDTPGPDDLALRGDGDDLTFDTVVPRVDWPAGVRVHTADTGLRTVLGHALAAWSLDGSVVISRGPAPADGYGPRVSSEGVDLHV